ncbi:hypothetical protein AAVH_10858 [Aphelenchoides avenae]|nr:hypothetical protein AAVH_10858 [Aphelenchus avenae]
MFFDTTLPTYAGQHLQSQTNVEPIRFAGNLATSCIDALSLQIHQLQSQLTTANQHNAWLEDQWRFKCEDCNSLEKRLQIADQRTATDKEHLKSFHVQLEKASQRISSLEVDLEITKGAVAAEGLSRAEVQDRLNARTSELEQANKRMQSTKDELKQAHMLLTEETVARLQAEAKLKEANERISILEAAVRSLVRAPDAVHSSERTASALPVDYPSAVVLDKGGAFAYEGLMHVVSNVKPEATEELDLDKDKTKQTTPQHQIEPSNPGPKSSGKAKALRRAVKRTSSVDAYRLAPKIAQKETSQADKLATEAALSQSFSQSKYC